MTNISLKIKIMEDGIPVIILPPEIRIIPLRRKKIKRRPLRYKKFSDLFKDEDDK